MCTYLFIFGMFLVLYLRDFKKLFDGGGGYNSNIKQITNLISLNECLMLKEPIVQESRKVLKKILYYLKTILVRKARGMHC